MLPPNVYLLAEWEDPHAYDPPANITVLYAAVPYASGQLELIGVDEKHIYTDQGIEWQIEEEHTLFGLVPKEIIDPGKVALAPSFWEQGTGEQLRGALDVLQNAREYDVESYGTARQVRFLQLPEGPRAYAWVRGYRAHLDYSRSTRTMVGSQHRLRVYRAGLRRLMFAPRERVVEGMSRGRAEEMVEQLAADDPKMKVSASASSSMGSVERPPPTRTVGSSSKGFPAAPSRGKKPTTWTMSLGHDPRM